MIKDTHKLLDEIFDIVKPTKQTKKEFQKALTDAVEKTEPLSKNDIVVYKKDDEIRKAVVTAIGKDGVTGRNSKREKVLIRNSQISRIEKRTKWK
jgi:uncharacterized protein (UPF0333 family)